MAHFRWPPYVDGWPCDACGHLGDCALQPIERAQYPSGERTSGKDGQGDQAQTAHRDEPPAAGDVARSHRGVHRDHDSTDQLAVATNTRSGQNRAGVPGQDACP